MPAEQGAKLPGAGMFLVEKAVKAATRWCPIFLCRRTCRDRGPADGQTQPLHRVHDACRGEGKTSTPFSYRHA